MERLTISVLLAMCLSLQTSLAKSVTNIVTYKGVPTDVQPAQTALARTDRQTADSIYTNLYLKYILNSEYEKLDIALLLDSSVSIGERNFDNGKQFLATLIAMMPRGDFSSTRIRTSMYSFSLSRDLTQEFAFNSMSYRETIRRRINNTTYQNQDSTHMTTALVWIDSIFTRSARRGAKKILIIATDGKSNDDSVDARGLYGPIETLDYHDVDTFALALGDSVDLTKLTVLTSGKSATNLYSIKDTDSTAGVLTSLATSLLANYRGS